MNNIIPMFNNDKVVVTLNRLAERLKPRLELNEYNILLSLSKYMSELKSISEDIFNLSTTINKLLHNIILSNNLTYNDKLYILDKIKTILVEYIDNNEL